jgi:ABC-type glycerol-3-phosphate transport system substrate-binding protein
MKTLLRLSIVLAALLLAACGFGEEPAPTPAPISLRYITFPGLAAVENVLIDRFETDNPHVTVERAEYAQAPEGYLAQPPVPDLMLISPGAFLDTAIAGGELTDLTSLWEESGAGAGTPPSLQTLSERDGKQFYMPVGYNWNGFYYDQAVFAQYGLQPPTTWEEFMQVCETLWLEGVVPLSIAGEDPLMGSLWLDYLNLRLNGPEVHRQLISGEIPFTDPRIRSVFELWASLVEKGYFHANAANMGAQEALAAVIQQGSLLGARPAMILSGPTFLGELPPERRAELGFFPFPVIDADQPASEVVMALGYMIPTDAPQRATALDFTAYLTSPEGRELVAGSIVAGGLYAPAFAVEDRAALPAGVRQGMAVVEGAQTVTAPFYLSVPDTMWPALGAMQRRLLTQPGSPAGFDLDALLAALEAAR